MDTLAMPEVIDFLEARVTENEQRADHGDCSVMPILVLLELYGRPPVVLKDAYRLIERRALGVALLASTLAYINHPDFREEWHRAILPNV